MFWIEIIIIVIIIGAAFYFRNQKINNAINNGDMIKRDDSFFKQNHTFKTHIGSIDEIYKALNAEAFTRDNMEYSLSSGKYIVFKKYIAGQGMTAVLRSLGQSDGLFVYRFAVEHFTTRKGMEAGGIPANIALTTVEKAIFSLDSTAQVERTLGYYKTR